MKQLKLFSLVLIGFMLSTMVVSCKDKDDDIDTRHEMVQANAKGIRIFYSDELIHESFYAYISSDVIKSMSESSEDYKMIVEANHKNLRYYPLTMDKVEELILENYSWMDIVSANDSPETKAIYNYANSVKTKYKYVAYDYGILLFNRTSDINY